VKVTTAKELKNQAGGKPSDSSESGRGVIGLDSILFVIDLHYPRDRHYRLNRTLLA
jgi:hypothetical protein